MNTYDDEVDGRLVKVKYKRGRHTDHLTLPKRRKHTPNREKDESRAPRRPNRERNR